jgi:hypothetical protein
MKFMATFKTLRMNGKGATLTFEVPSDAVGEMEGIQTLINDWVNIQVDPYQMSIDNMMVVSDGN